MDKTKFQRKWNLPFSVKIGDGKLDKWTPHTMTSDWTCFTDGSLMDHKSGAGAKLCNKDNEVLKIFTLKEGLREATVYQSELRAIEMTANFLTEKDVNFKTIEFYVDNQAALKSISALGCKQITVKRARGALIALGTKMNTVKLTWVQAHKGQMGNEAADKAAKSATNLKPSGMDVPLSMASAKQALKEKIKREWTKEWSNIKDHRQSKYFLAGPDPKFRMLLRYSRSNISQFIRSMTGHSFMKRHTNEIIGNDAEDKNCRLCEEEPETPHHIITECPVLLHRRNEYFGKRFLPETFTTWKVQEMIKFLDATIIQELEQE